MATYDENGNWIGTGSQGDGGPDDNYERFSAQQALATKYPNSVLTGPGQYGGDSTAKYFGYPTWKAYVESIQGPGAWTEASPGVDGGAATMAYTPTGGLQPMPEYNPKDHDFQNWLGAMTLMMGGGAALSGAGMLGGAAVGEMGALSGATSSVGGLSPETLTWLQSAGYAPEEIASIGSQFGAGGAITGIGAADVGFYGGGSEVAGGNVADYGRGADFDSLVSDYGVTPGGLQSTQLSPWEQIYQLWNGTPPTGVPGGNNGGNNPGVGSMVSGALSIGSGLYGLTQAEKLKKMAEIAAQKSDPFGMSGGRAMADQQLQALMADPSQVAAGDPAYKLRIQAAQRAMAPMGQNSGAMAVAGANASTDWYNQRLQQLGTLAGAGFSPAQGQSVGLQGIQAAAGLGSSAQAGIGYGVNTMLGGTNSNAALLAQLAALIKQRG